MAKKRKPGKRPGRPRIDVERHPCGQPKEERIEPTAELVARRAILAQHGDPVKSVTPVLTLNARGILTDGEARACERYAYDYKRVWGSGYPRESALSPRIAETRTSDFDGTIEARQRLDKAERVIFCNDVGVWKSFVVDCDYPEWMYAPRELTRNELEQMKSVLVIAYNLEKIYVGA